MSRNVSLATRVAYCIVVLGAVLPVGMATSIWLIRISGANALSLLPALAPLLLLAIGLYRIYLVLRRPSTLAVPPTQGGLAFLRMAGQVLMYAGAVLVVVRWLAVSVMHSTTFGLSQGSMLLYLVTVTLGLFGQVGVLGLLLFEISRLRAFEVQASQAG